MYYFRAKFESKKGQEDLGKVSQIVERIRVQLEDQDKTIQQMHSNIATTKLSQTIEEVSYFMFHNLVGLFKFLITKHSLPF